MSWNLKGQNRTIITKLGVPITADPRRVDASAHVSIPPESGGSGRLGASALPFRRQGELDSERMAGVCMHDEGPLERTVLLRIYPRMRRAYVRPDRLDQLTKTLWIRYSRVRSFLIFFFFLLENHVQFNWTLSH